MKVFISGKITGDENYRAKFQTAADALTAEGHTVLNPAILPDGFTVGEYMKMGLAMLDCADVIYMLPDWKESRGATIEHEYASYSGKEIKYFTDVYFTTDVVTNVYDKEEIYPNCTVQVLTNTVTGEQSVGWWKNGDQSVGHWYIQEEENEQTEN